MEYPIKASTNCEEGVTKPKAPNAKVMLWPIVKPVITMIKFFKAKPRINIAKRNAQKQKKSDKSKNKESKKHKKRSPKIIMQILNIQWKM